MPASGGAHAYSLKQAWLLRFISTFRHDRQSVDFSSSFCFSHAQILGGLQIQPELGAIAEPVAEAQGGVPCDGPLACDDLAHTIRLIRGGAVLSLQTAISPRPAE